MYFIYWWSDFYDCYVYLVKKMNRFWDKIICVLLFFSHYIYLLLHCLNIAKLCPKPSSEGIGYTDKLIILVLVNVDFSGGLDGRNPRAWACCNDQVKLALICKLLDNEEPFIHSLGMFVVRPLNANNLTNHPYSNVGMILLESLVTWSLIL